MQQYFVVGHPVAHSLSPRIHKMFAAQFDLDIDYEAYDIEAGSFIPGMAVLLRERKPQGVNVTVPFKEDAYAYCEEVTDRARACRAVNTIVFEDGHAKGDNTDGVGFVRDVMTRCAQPLQGARVLVAGAGGASRGVIAALKPLGCAKIAVANRSPDRALALGQEMDVESMSFVDTACGGWDVIVNATSASLDGVSPAIPNAAFKDCRLAYDLFYSQEPTPFMRLAAESGVAHIEDGLGMLVEQAAEAFRIWLGRSPETASVYAALR